MYASDQVCAGTQPISREHATAPKKLRGKNKQTAATKDDQSSNPRGSAPTTAAAGSGHKKRSPEEQAAAKELASDIRKLTDLKRSMDEATSSAADLGVLISSDPTWVWANTAPFMDPLRACRKAVEQSKGRNSFWKAWTHEMNFASVARSQFTPQVIRLEVSDPSGGFALSAAVDKLRIQVKKLKNMHTKMQAS